jgi:CBS domain-containing protein
MLQHLGAAYYQTLQGQATAADVARAVDAVTAYETHHNGSPAHAVNGAVGAAPIHHPRRWRVRDVMTTDVVTVEKTTPYKQVARLITEHRVSGLPVLTRSGRVLGMVSEADVLRKEERGFRPRSSILSRRLRLERAKAEARTAGELMTSPVITIHPDARLGAAAMLMNEHHIRRLAVIDESGHLIGIVGRADLLKVFLRPDDEIASEVAGVLGSIVLEDASGITVSVRNGVVTLKGTLAYEDLIPVVSRLASDVAGVVDVISKLTHEAPSREPAAIADR